jgi:DNA-binding transcriptional MerR regulator
MSAKPPYDTMHNMPRYLHGMLNTPPDQRVQWASKYPNPFFNADPDTFAEVEELVSVWLKADRDKNRFRALLLKRGKSVRAFSEYTIHEPVPRIVEIEQGDSSGKVIKRRMRVGAPFVTPVKGSSHAEGIFLQFMLHPDNWQLSGPCERCGEYFLREKRTARKYCAAKCGSFSTARKSTIEARKAEHDRKLAAVNEHIAAWQRSKSKQDWKEYVAQRAGVTTKLLTRWVNEGIIAVPTQQGGKHKA